MSSLNSRAKARAILASLLLTVSAGQLSATTMARPAEADQLDATLVGLGSISGGQHLAIRWTGDPAMDVAVWADLDGDGLASPAEAVLESTTLESGLVLTELPARHDLTGRLGGEDPSLIFELSRRGQSLGRFAQAVHRTSLTSAQAPSPRLAGEGPCAWQPGFQGQSPNGTISAALVRNENSGPVLYIGGQFTAINDVFANRIARWDGTQWSSLGTGMDDQVSALAVYDDGTGEALYAAGSFTRAGGVDVNRIARWDGTQWSTLGDGLSSGVLALHVFEEDGEEMLVAGGFFSMAGGAEARLVAGWDGTSWTPFGLDLGGISGGVFTLESFDAGGGPELYAGGLFTDSEGPSYLARWDGTAWQEVGGNLGETVFALETHDDGSGEALYAGGAFSAATGSPVDSLGRWDGIAWSEVGSGVSGPVFTLASLQFGGNYLFVTGDFDQAGAAPANNIARWDGQAWTALDPGLGQSALLVTFGQGLGSVLVVAGLFEGIEGVPARYLAQWDGSAFAPFGVANPGLGAAGPVLDLHVFDDGGGPALYVAGDFASVGTVPARRVAIWTAPAGKASDKVWIAPSRPWRRSSRPASRCFTPRAPSPKPATSLRITSRGGRTEPGPRWARAWRGASRPSRPSTTAAAPRSMPRSTIRWLSRPKSSGGTGPSGLSSAPGSFDG